MTRQNWHMGFLMLGLVCGAIGCGAPLADVTATATAAATYTTDTLLVSCQADPANAATYKADATMLLTNCQTAIADAKAMPSTAQLEQDAAAAIQIIEEIIAVIPNILPIFGAQRAGTPLTDQQAATLAKFYDLKVRLQVIQHRTAKAARSL